MISQSESEEPPKEWNDLCITSRYQTDFDENDPIRLDDDWLTTEELILRRHQDAENRVIPPQPPLNYMNMEPLIIPDINPPLPTSANPPELPREQPTLQKEEPSPQREKSTTSPASQTVISTPINKTSILQPPMDGSTKPDTPRPVRIRSRPTKYNAFDVKYGTLSAVNAYFAMLPDILRDPITQKEFELDTMENMLKQVASTMETLTTNLFAFVASKSDPDTLMYHEAMMASDKQEFRDAMEVEITALERQNTWNIVPRTSATIQNKKVLPGTWTFKRKRYPDGRIRKYKARFCLRGDKQIIGVDVFETYAPVVQWSSVRLCFILSVILGLSSRQVDYTNAFVQTQVKSPMFVELPKGFESNGDDDNILQLNKNLYGSRDAPLAWFEALKHSLESRGFKASDIDPCLFIHKHMIVLCFVDDLDRKSTRLNSSHRNTSRMPSSA